jgi:hypothetical protein
MKTVLVDLSDKLYKQVEHEARRRHTSKSALVKILLENHFRFANGKRKTVRELAGDLIGSLEGPGDLSYDPKHMEGFGQ